MNIVYVELKEAVSVPGNYGKRLFTLRAKGENDSENGDWFSFQELPNRTLAARFRDNHAVLVVTPFENIKQMHATLPAPAPKGKQ